MTDFDPGFGDLLASLSALGADSLLPLPGVDEPTRASTYVRQVLELCKGRELSFDSAWASAINRLQAPQGEGGFIEDPVVGHLVLEERALLEEDRPRWQAAYEGRAPTTREAAVCTVRAWRRIEGAGIHGLLAKRAA